MITDHNINMKSMITEELDPGTNTDLRIFDHPTHENVSCSVVVFEFTIVVLFKFFFHRNSSSS